MTERTPVNLSPLVRALVDTSPDAAAVVDTELFVVHANRQYLRLADIAPRQLKTGKLQGICHTHLYLDPCKTDGCLTRRAMELERSIRLDEVGSERLTELRVNWVAVPLNGSDGKVVGCMEILRDVSAESRMQSNYKGLLDRERRRNEILQVEVKKRTADLQRANDALNRALQQVSTLARTDPLTMLNNRRVFDEVIQREMQRASRFQRDLSLLMFDVDHFKQVNDVHGHQRGDEVLRTIARLFEKQVRTVDLVARFGGEEFALILPETSHADALIVANRIREAQAASGVTLSCGCATYPKDGNDPEALIAAADAAMYRAKQGGRNKVVSSQR